MTKRSRVPTVSVEGLVRAFEEAIQSLVRKFLRHPYDFYTEADLHCYLYHRLYRGGLANGRHVTAEGRPTILLHKEYPTCSRYRRRPDRLLEECEEGRRRGAFDICIWDPRHVAANTHRTQKVLCAAELALNECSAKNIHTINDCTKLAGATNAAIGYLLFFVRDCGSYAKHCDAIQATLGAAAKQVRVVFAHYNAKGEKTFSYLGDWNKSAM